MAEGTSEGGLTRRLAAIVVADVAGYSRLMETDEAGTFDRVRSFRAEVVEPTTQRFRGRVVKGTGDGWLAEFPSATDAVLSSMEIQRAAARRNARVAAARKLELRIGINVGEIIIDRDDIYGTGVNVAARLESIATPGGVCISDAVQRQVQGTLDLEFDDLGPQAVKNIAEPVHAFTVRSGRARRRAANGAAARGTRPAAGGASIAVLPFSNLSGDQDQEHFADAMVEDIITALSRFKWLAVIARASTFAYKGRSVDVRRFAQDLGVRYVLEGSVQKSGLRVRLTGQLIEAASGSHLWADRFEGRLEDVFDLQDRMTEQVVSTLEPQIRRVEIERARHERPENLDAYHLFLRAMPHAYAMRREDNVAALALLQEAMRLDPGYAPAAAFAAWCYEQRLTRGWPEMRESDPVEAVRLARQALAADTDDANTISISGFVLVMVGRDYEPGFAALARAVELNPNNSFVLMNWAWANAFAGDLETALSSFERARSLSRQDPAAFFVLTGLAMVNLLLGEFDAAADFARESVSVYDGWEATHFFHALSLAAAGRGDEARHAAERLRSLMPGADLAEFIAHVPLRDPVRRAYVEQRMREAGMLP